MANHASAVKRAKRNAKYAEVNGARISRVRTFIKKVEMALAGGDAKAAQEALKNAQPEIHRAVAKGLIHKNTAARKISRLAAKVKAAS